MTENLEFSVQGLFDEVVEQGTAQGVADQEAFDELVDEIIEAHLSVGELKDDQDLEGFAAAVKGRWSDYKRALELGE